MTLIIYEKSRFFLRTWIRHRLYTSSSPLSRPRAIVSFASWTSADRRAKRREKEKGKDRRRKEGVNKIPINLHYTINPMRGRQHSPFWIFPTLFPQDRYSCGRAPIRRTGKVPPPIEASRRSLCASEYVLERSDRSLFRVVHRIYASNVYILLVYEGNIQRQSRLYTRNTFVRYANIALFLNSRECETWEDTKHNMPRWLTFLSMFCYENSDFP